MSDMQSKGDQGSPRSGNADSPDDAADPARLRPAPVDIHAHIASRLREVYDDVARQPVPDRFLDLMRQLEGK